MVVEDGAVLAKLFSHLNSREQIGNFLWAFQDIRQPRLKNVREAELGNLAFMTLPPGEIQQMRDSHMQAKHAAGRNILDPMSDDEGENMANNEWVELKEVFGYDAEGRLPPAVISTSTDPDLLRRGRQLVGRMGPTAGAGTKDEPGARKIPYNF